MAEEIDTFEIPAGTVALGLAVDTEAAGEVPVKHAMYALGACVLALGAPAGPGKLGTIRELGRYLAKGWRVGTTRVSERCASEYLSHANDAIEDELLYDARVRAKEGGWHTLHEFPRVAPFVHDYAYSAAKTSAHLGPLGAERVELLRELEMYKGFVEFRNGWLEAAKRAGVPLKLCTDNGLFDGGWLMALAAGATWCLNAHAPLPMPNYAALDNDGNCRKYLSVHDSCASLKGFVAGLHLALDIDPADAHPDALSALRALAPDLPAPAHAHDHSPDNDAYTIAYSYLAREGVARGIFPLRDATPSAPVEKMFFMDEIPFMSPEITNLLVYPLPKKRACTDAPPNASMDAVE